MNEKNEMSLKGQAFRWEFLKDMPDDSLFLEHKKSVVLHRMFQGAMMDVLSCEYGSIASTGYFEAALQLAGTELAKNLMRQSLGLTDVVSKVENQITSYAFSKHISEETSFMRFFHKLFSKKVKSENTEHKVFAWSSLNKISQGKDPDEMSIASYLYMQYALIQVLESALGEEKTLACIQAAGTVAGREFSASVLNVKRTFEEFVGQLRDVFRLLGVGQFNFGLSSASSGKMVLSLNGAVDDTTLPFVDHVTNTFVDGFISGIIEKQGDNNGHTVEQGM